MQWRGRGPIESATASPEALKVQGVDTRHQHRPLYLADPSPGQGVPQLGQREEYTGNEGGGGHRGGSGRGREGEAAAGVRSGRHARLEIDDVERPVREDPDEGWVPDRGK